MFYIVLIVLLFSRTLPPYEQHHIVKYTLDILNGRLENLPLILFYNRLTIELKATWTQKYRQCINKRYTKTYDWMQKWKKEKCKTCASLADWPKVEQCYSQAVKNDGSVEQWEKFTPCCNLEKIIKCHRKCADTMIAHMKPCMEHINYARRNCSQKNLIGIKAIRMPMSVVEKILQEDPEIKVIHYIRDPRGIVASRQKSKWLQSSVAKKSWDREITLLCNKMQDDITARKRLEEKYPNSIFTIKYEDFAADPIHHGQKVYDHIGTSFPEDLQYWLYNSTHSTNKGAGAAFTTVRKDGSKAAFSWKKRLSASVQARWTKLCQGLLESLDYEKSKTKLKSRMA